MSRDDSNQLKPGTPRVIVGCNRKEIWGGNRLITVSSSRRARLASQRIISNSASFLLGELPQRRFFIRQSFDYENCKFSD